MKMTQSKYHSIPGISRRTLLRTAANGFGAIAMAALWGSDSQAQERAQESKISETSKPPHFPPKARSVIFLFMEGAVSQVDSFDFKPMLEKHHGENPRQTIGKLEKTQFENIGTVMKSPWAFHQRGQSGLWVSDLFPHIASQADELCVINPSYGVAHDFRLFCGPNRT